MPVELIAGTKAKGETKKAIIACNDYLRMGIGRSLEKLVQTYTEHSPDSAPTKHLSILKGWSARFGWQDRAGMYDAAIEAQKDARRREVMNSRLALDYVRVEELSELFDELKREFNKSGLWYTDTKISASGVSVDVEVFNKPLIDSLRATLDDIAKEKGERKQNVDMKLSGSVDITADERAQAAKELEEWQRENRKADATSNG